MPDTTTEENRPKADKNGEQSKTALAPSGEAARFFDNRNDPVEIFYNKPLPEMDNGPIKAYAARGRDSTGYNYFALICERHLVPRINAANIYQNLGHTILVSLVSHGVVYWPPAREERYVFLYRNTLSKRVHVPGSEEALGWRQDTVMESLVRPMAEMLREFRDTNFVHGSIRPSNIFLTSANVSKVQHLVLGDCLSTPASYLQPSLYETIERSMAQPGARGAGTPADDMYSFGVTLAVFLRLSDPLREMNEQQVIREKIEQGSYAAITGKDRFKGSILELLRGLLHDDPHERWTIEEVITWLDGRRLSPKQILKRKKASRPLTFDNARHVYTATLANDLEKNMPETAKLVAEGTLDQWIQRSIEDDELIERVATAINTSHEKGTGPGYEERLAAQLSIALDPQAPIRYKGLHLAGDGIGTALVESLHLKQDIQRYMELFSQGIALTWLNTTKSTSVDPGLLIAKYDQCRNFIRHGKPGYGLERCIYILAPECPCLSEKLRPYFVRSPEDMIRAFEDMCQKGNAPAMFLDRHSMAFLSVKEQKIIDPFLFDLSAKEEFRKVLGNLKCLAALQKRSNMPNYPGIAKVFAEALPAVYERYHDRDAREKIEAAMKKYIAEGDLSKMAALLANADMNKEDYIAFRRAMKEYSDLSREYRLLTQRLADKNKFGVSAGREISAVVSGVIAAFAIAVSSFFFLSQ